MTAESTPATTPRCPICRRPMAPAYRPFCSARCRDIDLARWLGGGYVVSGAPASDDDEEARLALDQGEPGRDGEDDRT